MVLAFCAGCPTVRDQAAKIVVEPPAFPGKAMQALAGGEGLLLKNGRIDAHHRVKVQDGAEIDTWVIRSRLHDPTGPERGSPFERQVSRGTAVLLHPLSAGKAWFLGLGGKLADRGWDVVLIDIRGHGYSDGQYITWGAREKQDVKTVLDRLLELEPISPDVYACGASMGGCIAVQYAAFDPRCRGVIALGPPADARAIGRRMLMLTTESFFDTAMTRAGELAGFDPKDASAVAAAAKLSCPLVVVHGSMDLVVPMGQGRAVFEAAKGPKKMIRLALAGHAPEIGREGWLADQFEVLTEMGRKEGRPDLAPTSAEATAGRPTIAAGPPSQ